MCNWDCSICEEWRHPYRLTLRRLLGGKLRERKRDLAPLYSSDRVLGGLREGTGLSSECLLKVEWTVECSKWGCDFSPRSLWYLAPPAHPPCFWCLGEYKVSVMSVRLHTSVCTAVWLSPHPRLVEDCLNDHFTCSFHVWGFLPLSTWLSVWHLWNECFRMSTLSPVEVPQVGWAYLGRASEKSTGKFC